MTKLTANAKRLLVLICAVLLLPGLSGLFFTDHSARRAAEKRELAPLPNEVVQLKKFFQDFDDYLNDHIGFFMAANKVYRQSLFLLFNETPTKNVSISRDGYVFLNSHSEERPYRVFQTYCPGSGSQEWIKDSILALNRTTTTLEELGHRAIYMPAITKPRLYPEKVPSDVDPAYIKCSHNYSMNDVILSLRDAVTRNGSIFHYPYESFLAMKEEAHFYPKENFHWKGKSAHEFSRELFERLSDSERLALLSADPYITSVKADSLGLGFSRNMQIWEYPYSSFGIKRLPYPNTGELKSVFPYARDYSYRETDNPLFGKDAILISDSFGSFTAKHLAAGYRSLTHVSLNGARDEDKAGVFRFLLSQRKNADILFLFQDISFLVGHVTKLQQTIAQAEKSVETTN